ncbi:hypothetical protein Zmor_006967 [Zophobas morio]|uniref:Uncharacterized protein n=1 Tax=Zophobas morio TaxID=2755281 RepID=A0AA38IVY5_9CUCU|nr:hypothetical protein Zmor_006967 [Zophobas morio]
MAPFLSLERKHFAKGCCFGSLGGGDVETVRRMKTMLCLYHDGRRLSTVKQENGSEYGSPINKSPKDFGFVLIFYAQCSTPYTPKLYFTSTVSYLTQGR